MEIQVARDYGYLDGGYAPKNTVTVTPRRQVYDVTHTGGGLRLPYMNRSFISFSFGGKPIEDFDLIATISGDRLERNGYASFEDITTQYDILEGQYYWSTHFKTNSLDLTLSTDGIDQKLLDEFLAWFIAGERRELILAEHPNRAIIARLSEPPALHLLPFETTTQIVISGNKYDVHTTLYKGDINITFIMDDPFWYAKSNILGKVDGNYYIDKWDDVNNNQQEITHSPDALKILYEDGIPLGSMVQHNMFLGGGIYATAEIEVTSRIWAPGVTPFLPHTDDSEDGAGACISGTLTVDGQEVTYVGTIAGASVSTGSTGKIDLLPANTPAYLFYSGTAPAFVTLEFELIPEMQNFNIISPRNSANDNIIYNTITLTGTKDIEFRFTAPNLITSYNKVISIFRNVAPGDEWERIYDRLRDEVHHAGVREWACAVVKYMGQAKDDGGIEDKNGLINNDVSFTLCDNMKYMLMDTSGNLYPMKFIFNGETGQSTGIFTYRKPGNANSENDLSQFGEPEINIEEDVGDMLLSNRLFLQERNITTNDGKIMHWENNRRTLSHKLTHDVSGGLQNLRVIYKNMYL